MVETLTVNTRDFYLSNKSYYKLGSNANSPCHVRGKEGLALEPNLITLFKTDVHDIMYLRRFLHFSKNVSTC